MINVFYRNFFWIYAYFNNTTLGKKIKIKGFIQIFNKGKILISDNCQINSGLRYNPIGGDTITRLVVRNGGEIIIKKNVGISNSTLVSSARITIGENTIIGGSCKIWDTDFHSINYTDRLSKPEKNIKSEPIIIGKNCFIGANSIILKGVEVGDNAVVAAGSIVTKDVIKNTIVAGSPAKFIKNIEN
ncbi:MAG: acyltransferase [Flavobacteriaceae bacterium]|nr:acyltransferase [Flavobacteriaceae bacterium]